MARNKEPKLGWLKDEKRVSGGRWHKIYKGKHFWFSDVQGKSDKEGYQRALAAYKTWAAQIDLVPVTKSIDPNYEAAIDIRQKMLKWVSVMDPSLSNPQFTGIIGMLMGEIVSLKKSASSRKPPELDSRSWDGVPNYEIPEPNGVLLNPINQLPDFDRLAWQRRIDDLSFISPVQAPQKATVAEKFEEFKELQKRRVNTGDLKPGSFSPLITRLKHFADFCGTMPASSINGDTWKKFHIHLQDEIIAKKATQSFSGSRFSAAKQFLRWLHNDSIIQELPRNLSSLRIKVETKKVECVSESDLQLIWTHADPRTKLYALLGLNCAMLPSDIANIRRNEFDPIAKTITRKRTKTGSSESVPTVTYKLWDETAQLLIDQMEADGDLVLTHDGRPVWENVENGSGNYSTFNHVENVWISLNRRIKKAEGTTVKSFMFLRKTGPTRLESSLEYGRYSQAFLGHAPSETVEKSYASADNVVIFAQVCRWLGNQFGFSTT